jgi:hypothetical protein
VSMPRLDCSRGTRLSRNTQKPAGRPAADLTTGIAALVELIQDKDGHPSCASGQVCPTRFGFDKSRRERVRILHYYSFISFFPAKISCRDGKVGQAARPAAGPPGPALPGGADLVAAMLPCGAGLTRGAA